jgi:ABC-type phosphate/phosphonate transport system permease subunit
MMIVLYIIGGIILFSLMVWSGFLKELLTLISVTLIGGLIGAIIGAILTSGTAEKGSQYGVWFAFGLYVLTCIVRIVDPEKVTYIYTDGSTENFNSRYPGVMGLIISILAVITYLCDK